MKSADNVIELTEKDSKKYIKLKEGESIKSSDLIHIEENTYAKVGKGNVLCKYKVTKYSTVLREK